MRNITKSYRNNPVVVDTSAKWVYLGIFAGEDDTYIMLEKADAFDMSEIYHWFILKSFNSKATFIYLIHILF